jgi:hypothetical protein
MTLAPFLGAMGLGLAFALSLWFSCTDGEGRGEEWVSTQQRNADRIVNDFVKELTEWEQEESQAAVQRVSGCVIIRSAPTAGLSTARWAGYLARETVWSYKALGSGRCAPHT